MQIDSGQFHLWFDSFQINLLLRMSDKRQWRNPCCNKILERERARWAYRGQRRCTSSERSLGRSSVCQRYAAHFREESSRSWPNHSKVHFVGAYQINIDDEDPENFPESIRIPNEVGSMRIFCGFESPRHVDLMADGGEQITKGFENAFNVKSSCCSSSSCR